jgi:DNA-binding CsgD family transcriptional regulator
VPREDGDRARRDVLHPDDNVSNDNRYDVLTTFTSRRSIGCLVRFAITGIGGVSNGVTMDDIARSGPFTPKGWELLVSHLQLSPRQAEIAQCLFRGMSDKQIAAELGIKIPTVRTHLERVFNKVDAQDRLEFVLAAMARACTHVCPRQR